MQTLTRTRERLHANHNIRACKWTSWTMRSAPIYRLQKTAMVKRMPQSTGEASEKVRFANFVRNLQENKKKQAELKINSLRGGRSNKKGSGASHNGSCAPTNRKASICCPLLCSHRPPSQYLLSAFVFPQTAEPVTYVVAFCSATMLSSSLGPRALQP